MAVPANTYKTFEAIGIKEGLQDIIYDVSPQDTPILSAIGKTKARNTLHEWQTDVLASPATNKHLEGNDADAAAVTPTVRIGNYCQILSKTVQVAGTLEAVDKAGRAGEKSYQTSRRAIELKKDLEFALCRNQASAAGSASVARAMGGLESGISTNVSHGSGGSTTAISGATFTAPTDGTQRTFTETIVKSVIKDMYTNGGEPKIAVVGPVSKQNFSTFTGIAAQRYMASGSEPTTIVGAAEVYLSDYGSTQVVPSRIVRDRTALFLDPEYAAVAYLRDFQTNELARTGDSEKSQILVEATLELRNEKAHGKAADLTV